LYAIREEFCAPILTAGPVPEKIQAEIQIIISVFLSFRTTLIFCPAIKN